MSNADLQESDKDGRRVLGGSLRIFRFSAQAMTREEKSKNNLVGRNSAITSSRTRENQGARGARLMAESAAILEWRVAHKYPPAPITFAPNAWAWETA